LFCKNDQKEQRLKAQKIFGNIKVENPVDQKSIDLGKKLFFEKALSINNTFSCNSCHVIDNYGVSNGNVNVEISSILIKRNIPTVYNSSLQNKQGWDGRFNSVKDISINSIFDKNKLGIPNQKHLVSKLKKLRYDNDFKEVDLPLNSDSVGLVLSRYIDTLVVRTRYDQWVDGEIDFNDDEISGFKLFYSSNCQSCHSSSTFGGKNLAKVGILKHFDVKDEGRYYITMNESDRQVFKVPMLRGITKTHPYFSDGSVNTLEEVIKIMGEYQLGKNFNEKQIDQIKTFLLTL
jgi:cytochrome c peroxidase